MASGLFEHKTGKIFVTNMIGLNAKDLNLRDI